MAGVRDAWCSLLDAVLAGYRPPGRRSVPTRWVRSGRTSTAARTGAGAWGRDDGPGAAGACSWSTRPPNRRTAAGPQLDPSHARPDSVVVPAQVVPDDQAAGSEDPFELVDDASRHALIADRAEHGSQRAPTRSTRCGTASPAASAARSGIVPTDRASVAAAPRADRSQSPGMVETSRVAIRVRAVPRPQPMSSRRRWRRSPGCTRSSASSIRRSRSGRNRTVAGVVRRPEVRSTTGAVVPGVDGGTPIGLGGGGAAAGSIRLTTASELPGRRPFDGVDPFDGDVGAATESLAHAVDDLPAVGVDQRMRRDHPHDESAWCLLHDLTLDHRWQTDEHPVEPDEPRPFGALSTSSTRPLTSASTGSDRPHVARLALTTRPGRRPGSG